MRATVASIESIRRRLGERAAEAEALLAAGMPGASVGRALGIDPRLVSTLRAALDSAPPPAPLASSPPPTLEPQAERPKRGSVARYRRLLTRDLPLHERSKLLSEAARSTSPAVRIRALERIDDLSGFMPQRQAPEAATATFPPLFALGLEPGVEPPAQQTPSPPHPPTPDRT